MIKVCSKGPFPTHNPCHPFAIISRTRGLLSETSTKPNCTGEGLNYVLVGLIGNSYYNFLFYPSKVVCYLRCSFTEHGCTQGETNVEWLKNWDGNLRGQAHREKRGGRGLLSFRETTLCAREIYALPRARATVYRGGYVDMYVYIYIYRQAKDSRKVQHWTTTLSRFQVKRRASL